MGTNSKCIENGQRVEVSSLAPPEWFEGQNAAASLFVSYDCWMDVVDSISDPEKAWDHLATRSYSVSSNDIGAVDLHPLMEVQA